MEELELLGIVNGLRVYVDEDAGYFLFMAKEIILDGKTEDGTDLLYIKDLK
ncbi:MAG: hypothetical protein ACTSO9_13405 [Candidatus Helarchaeota archaeon]